MQNYNKKIINWKLSCTNKKNYVEQLLQNSCQKSYANYQKPIRKRKHYHEIQQEESDKSDSYITEIRRRPKKTKRKRIVYEDELDDVPTYEPESPSEEEQEDNNEIEVKHNKKLQPKNPKKIRKGITKSTKM